MKLKIFFNLIAIFCVIIPLNSFALNSVYMPEKNLLATFANDESLINGLKKSHGDAVAAAGNRSVNVSIIGLVAALQAYVAGAKVVPIEKRDMYTRQQILAIDATKLKPLLKHIKTTESGSAFIEINRLEPLMDRSFVLIR